MDDEYKNFIETVRAKSDLAEVVSEYVPLKKSGGKLWGCCPFHQEKTASFSVSPDKGLFYCFGCQTGGDIFSFVQKLENLSFPEAAALLAGKCGVPLPETHKNEQARQREAGAKEIYEVNALAADYFAACLYKTADGRNALAYLRRRGIGEDTAKRFSIGFAPGGGRALCQALGKRGISPALLLKARLAVQRSEADYQDAFRLRVMLPVREQRGKVAGFGGRTLTDDGPKYINTAEGKFFSKKNLLYGFDVALNAIKTSGQALVVEGYMDAIALHSHGFVNAVASMGTAFSAEQARLLGRAAKEVIFCYDSDRAGQQAAVRAISLFRENGGKALVKAVMVDGAKDPDEFIGKFGAEKFSALLSQARDGWHFQKAFFMGQADFSTLAGKIEIVSKTLPIIAELENNIFRQNAVIELARDLMLDEAAIDGELRKYLAKHDKYNVPLSADTWRRDGNNLLQKAESRLILAALRQPAVLGQLSGALAGIKDRYAAICREIYGDEPEANGPELSGQAREVFAMLYEWQDKGYSKAQFMALLPEDTRALVAGLEMEQEDGADSEQVVHDCLKQIARAFWENKYNESRTLAAQYENAGDGRYLRELAKSREFKNETIALF